MQTTALKKDQVIEKWTQLIEASDVSANEWKVGIATIQRASLLPVREEIYYQIIPLDAASEVLFHFLAQGVKNCNFSKSNCNGIYLYR